MESSLNTNNSTNNNNPSNSSNNNSSNNPTQLPLLPTDSKLPEQSQIEFDIKKILDEIKNEQSNMMTSAGQLKRLLNTNFLTPYEVLMINHDSTDEEIKKQYRQLSMLVHPDKCQDTKASDAFHTLETAYKTLQDIEKKKFFQRIIREAKERVEIDRKLEDKIRMKKGQPPLPKDNLEIDYKQMIQKVINEIEERKEHSERIENAYKKRERDEEELRHTQEEYDKMYNKEWESYRDKRVKNWNKFQGKIKGGKRKGKYEIKPPKYKSEERVENKIDIYRPNPMSM